MDGVVTQVLPNLTHPKVIGLRGGQLNAQRRADQQAANSGALALIVLKRADGFRNDAQNLLGFVRPRQRHKPYPMPKIF